jgi:hypothetical protein
LGVFRQKECEEMSLLSLPSQAKQAAMNLLGFDPDRRYFHGSTHDITEFSKDMASPEGHFGAGFYFSSSPEDVASYYATVPNPDLSAKVSRRAEELASERDVDYEDVLDEAYKEIAGESQGTTYPIRLRTQNTFDISQDGDTFLEYRGPELDPEDYRDEAMNDIFESDYDSVNDYEEALRERMNDLAIEDSYNFEPEGPLVDFIDSIRRNEFVDQDQAEELIAKIQEEAIDGGIDAKRLDKIFRDTPLYAEDDMGRLVDNEVYRQAIEDAGFDSIVHDANIFKGMERTPEGTKHTIVFEPNQIRSEYAEYNPDNADSGNILASALGYGATGLLGASALMSPEAEAGAATQFIRLLEAGYPESTARKIMSGELPMDEASRINRAREQGKDIDRNLIHRSPVEGILEFESSKSGRMGPAVYATPLDDYGLSFGGNQYNLVAENIPATNRQRLELVETLSRNLLDQGVDPRVAYQQAQVEANDILRSQGYTTVEMTDRRGRVTEVAILDPTNIRDRDRAAFDPDQVNNPNILATPAPVGAVGGLLASEAATPEGQLNPLLAVPAEVGSALNEAVVGTLDFLGPDTINAISELIGSEYRMPRLSDQELVRLYTQGGYMDEGYGRDAIRTATGLLSPL